MAAIAVEVAMSKYAGAVAEEERSGRSDVGGES